MVIQISSGIGSPKECEFAVGKLSDSFCLEFPDMEVLTRHVSKKTGLPSSVVLRTAEDVSELDGTVQCIFKSPFRPDHKRKNWYVDVSVIKEVKEIVREKDIRWETFKSGGNGGQHVNKTESGVRLIHLPTQVTVTATLRRSQWMNKKDALEKLNIILNEMEKEELKRRGYQAWKEQTKLIRGNPIRVYRGLKFDREMMHGIN